MSVHEIKKQEHLEKSNKSINKNEAHPISACSLRLVGVLVGDTVECVSVVSLMILLTAVWMDPEWGSYSVVLLLLMSPYL